MKTNNYGLLTKYFYLTLTQQNLNQVIIMDTDDLSQEAYKAIILESEKFHHDLTLRFGLLSGHCEDEHEFIEKSIKLIESYKNADLDDMTNIFFGNIPNLKELNKALDKILTNIEKVKKIPYDKRHFDF